MPATNHGKSDDEGVALVITLLLLFLMSVMGLAAVLTSSSDLLINGYYRNYRGSFYAADSGLNIARADIVNYLTNNGPTTFANPPIADPVAWGNSAAAAITASYGNSYSLNAYGQATNSWAESFKVTSVSVAPAQGTPTGSVPVNGNFTVYGYVYNYDLVVVGSAQGSEQGTVHEAGSVNLTVTAGPGTTGTDVSFAAFGTFIDDFDRCSAQLVPGYMTGPMYAHGAWNLGSSSTGYTFTDPVSQTESRFSYWPSSGGCVESSQPKYGTIVPSFQSGYNLNSATIPLPANSFSQKWAVLDGKGCGENSGNACGDPTSPAPTAPTAADMNAKLRKASQTAYPSAGASSGVYLPYSCSGGTCTMNSDAGGILVEGNASVTLTASGSSAQVYTITQAPPTVSATVTTTVTIDPNANTTRLQQSGGGTYDVTIAGIPHNALTGDASTMLYVDGNVTSISGPSSGAAIQDNAMVTVTAIGDITATGNITYKTEPVTTSANQIIPGSSPACCNGSPIDTLIPQNQNMNQVLGLYTSGGNFILSPSTNGANIEVDASIAMLSQAGISNTNIGHMATGNSVGTFTNIGGRIENRAHSVSMNKSNVYFDRRFTARSDFAPPWFPSTTVSRNVISGTMSAMTTPGTPSRVLWQYRTAGQ
jgi:hypothetical protein